MRESQALLHHPVAGYMVRELGTGVLEVIMPAQGFRTEASGIIAEEIRSILKGEPASERLQSMAEALPWLSHIAKSHGPAVPLTVQAALGTDRLGLLFVEVTGNCNERCLHCYADAGPNVRASLSRDTLLTLVEDAASLDVSVIQFTGGDPFLHPDLLAAVALATSRDVQVEIYTNGLLLTEKRLTQLLPHRPAMAFSLYSHIAEIHDEVTRTPGSLKKTLAAIERSVAAELPTRVGMVAMESNAAHLKESVALLRSMGVQRINVTPSFEVGRGEQYLGDMPDEVFQGHGARQQLGVARSKLCITYQGDVVPCIFNRSQILGRVGPERRLTEVLAAPLVRASGRAMDEILKRCSSKLQCAGCRNTATALELLGGACDA